MGAVSGNLEIDMFTLDSTNGFSQSDINLMNQALEVLVERGIDESNAADIVNNNWQPSGNTVDSLTVVTHAA